MSNKEKVLVCFDTETTGLIKPNVVELEKQPEIIELYMAKLIFRSDGVFEQIDEIDTFLTPKGPISEEITRITGITPLMVKGAPTFGDIFPRIQQFHVGVHAWVAHNCAFDTAMMANEISRIGKIVHMPFPPRKICTVQASMSIEQRRLTLSNLHKELFGEPFEGAHRAKVDVQAMIRCFKKLFEMGMIKL
jgi:DNA polymerase III alpha subunit (gram-positive type)